MTPSDQHPRESPAGEGPRVLASLFAQPVALPVDEASLVEREAKRGLAFFESLNESRLKLAFASFDEDMRKALFEILFLLHVNDPRLAELKYKGTRHEQVDGVRKEVEVELTDNLYLEGAPSGVRGFENLSPVFREDFEAYIRETFGMQPFGAASEAPAPIMGISAGGSVGTIGHKSVASDLDVNVQYDLTPFLMEPSAWNDDTFREALATERDYWMERERREQGLMAEAVHDPSVKQNLEARAAEHLAKAYPHLLPCLEQTQAPNDEALRAEAANSQRGELTKELMRLMKRAASISAGGKQTKREALLRDRIQRIETYVTGKFPAAEIHLFPCSNEDFRAGRHASTLESKESPGSAYELLLNYETLLPGIQFTSTVPTHFLIPRAIQDDPGLYNRYIDRIRFNLLEAYAPCRERLVDFGPTPDLEVAYVARHRGAVYWEAFKASSGNLPKATLNLFRFEMLLDKRLLKTEIQLIKEPHLLDAMITPKPGKGAENEIAAGEAEAGMPNWMLPELERQFPMLLQDPWWLRYKALKIGFGEQQGAEDLSPEERAQASRMFDRAFALHVRISDVFSRPGDRRTFDSHRERVLLEFLERAFPAGSPRRTFLEHMFAGEVRAINRFEETLRELFTNCLERVNRKIAAFNLEDESGREEFDVWRHYYRQNFQPAPNVVQRSIMHHLKVPRGRLVTGHEEGRGWVFHSMQRESGVGKRFDTFGTMDHLPDEVELHENPSFLGGLAHCVLNGYYGVLNGGTLNERRTALELDAKAMDMGHPAHNTLAFVRPDQVERIIERVHEVFPYRQFHYLDCIRLQRNITEVYVFLNLLLFGRLSILYRDNLQTWRCDEFDHAAMLGQAKQLSASARAMMAAEPIHATLGGFFQQQAIRPQHIKLAAWVNPNSITTGSDLFLRKEQQLASDMEAMILTMHKDTPLAASAPEAAGEPVGGEPGRAQDWKGTYFELMKRAGLNPERLGRTRKHPHFKPHKAGNPLSVTTEEHGGKLVSIAADGLVYSSSQPFPPGRKIFVEIEDAIVVRAQIISCHKESEGKAGGGKFRITAKLLDEEEGYQCFVRVITHFSDPTH